MGHPTYLYRRSESGEIEAKIFDSDNLPEGWVDSPAKVDEAKPEPQASPNFESMTKEQLEHYARKYGVELDRRKTKSALIAEVKALGDR